MYDKLRLEFDKTVGTWDKSKKFWEGDDAKNDPALKGRPALKKPNF